MNTRELRIGNYVNVRGVGIVKVNGITRHKIGYCPKPNYEKYARNREVEPVELTSDIFSKLQFDMDICKKLNLHLKRKGVGVPYCIDFEIGTEVRLTARYLHELQNLYFDICKEELKIEKLSQCCES